MTLTLAELEKRVESIPEALAKALAVRLPDGLPELSTEQEACFDVVGVGASELSARLLVQVLSRAGFAAQFLPVAYFVAPPPEIATRSLVVFSQGLSPNARIALECAPRYRHSLLFTSVRPGSEHPRASFTNLAEKVVCHPPESESGSLVRFVGPMCSALSALRVAAVLLAECGIESPWTSRLGEVPDAYKGPELPAIGTDPAVCIALGDELEMARGLMWKWQEALYVPLPIATDVFSFVHGPLQAHFDREATFLALGSRAEENLRARLSRSLSADRHRLVVIPAALPFPLSLFDFDAAVTRLILLEMTARGIDPNNWPGKLSDGPLYAIAKPGEFGS